MEQEKKAKLQETLLKSSTAIQEEKEVCGCDFSKETDLNTLLQFFSTTGFQATNIGKAIEIINKMRKEPNCKIFFGYTSNMISSGLRETIRFLVKNKMIDAIVTTGGGIEEDLIKCLGKSYLKDGSYCGKEQYEKGHNMIGNLFIPNNNYGAFEDWLWPILDKMIEEQKEEGAWWTPRKMIERLGAEINNEESVYYWAAKNKIPVYCPALIDGSIGDMIYMHEFKNSGLKLDIVEDLCELNRTAMFTKQTGMIILGGGLVKHHIANANLMKNGANYAVYINTGIEHDGSDAGASTEEAISWGKIHTQGEHVKVWCDATIAFPLIVSQTFAKKLC